jgi:hypothetical protein
MAARLSVAVHRSRMGQRDIIINEMETADPAISHRPPTALGFASASDAVGVDPISPCCRAPRSPVYWFVTMEDGLFFSTSYPCSGLTLREEVLTLEGVLRSADRQSCGGFPEFTMAQSVVRGPVGAAGAVVRSTGSGSASAETASAEPGSARPGTSGGAVTSARAVAFPRPVVAGTIIPGTVFFQGSVVSGRGGSAETTSTDSDSAEPASAKPGSAETTIAESGSAESVSDHAGQQ